MIDPIGFARFEKAMAADPLARPPRGSPRFGAPAWLAALSHREAPVWFDACFRLRANNGGGDCLFHALSGTDLEPGRLRETRREIAAIRLCMPAAPRANARRVIASLLQTPETRGFGIALADRGLAAASNATLAALQAVTGIHAGEAEICQWCAARRAGVLVVDARGWISRLRASGVRRSMADPAAGLAMVDRAVRRGDVVLFKTNGHWRRIEGVAAGA